MKTTTILTTLNTAFFTIISLMAAASRVNAASQPVSSIRETVIDADSRVPLVGVSIALAGTDPMIGKVSDLNGEFRFEELPVGRYTLNVYYLGYESKTLNNILLHSGKESVIRIELIQSLIELEKVTVRAHPNKGDPLNQPAVISARSFTVEETERNAGSSNDPGRMAASCAGVFDINLCKRNDESGNIPSRPESSVLKRVWRGLL
jgi:hypothetical protein